MSIRDPMTIEAIRERASRSVIWLEGHTIPIEVADALWQAKRDVSYMLALHEFNNRAYTDVQKAVREPEAAP